jgi:hypothetical protein
MLDEAYRLKGQRASSRYQPTPAGLRDGNWSFAIVTDFTDADPHRAYDQDEEHNRARAAKHLAGCRQPPERLGEEPVPVRFQLVIDCADPDRLARFWAAALGYELAPPPAGFATWNDFYRELGVAEEELVDGADRISDPEGHGPIIWFHVVPDPKAVKNRLHLDIHASGERTDPIETRRKRVDAEASRLVGLGATITGALSEEGLDHYAVGMKDPEGNEFDIN